MLRASRGVINILRIYSGSHSEVTQMFLRPFRKGAGRLEGVVLETSMKSQEIPFFNHVVGWELLVNVPKL